MNGFRIMCSLESWSETSFQTALNTASQRRHQSSGLTLIDGGLVFGVALDVLGEPLVELFVGIEQRRHDEMQQGPQLRHKHPSTRVSCTLQLTPTHTAHLCHRVLDRRPGEQQSVSTLELQQDFPPNAGNTNGDQ